jgi:endoglucanase
MHRSLRLFCCATALWTISGLVLLGCAPKNAPAGTATNAAAAGTDLPPPSGGNLLLNADFGAGKTLPWTSSFTAPASGELELRDGAACLVIQQPGVNKWDAQIRHRDIVVQKGHTYTVAIEIWADQKSRASLKVGMSSPPYGEYWNQVVDIGPEPQVIRGEFTMQAADDTTAELAFHLGGGLLKGATLPITVCIDDAFLTDPAFVPPPKAPERVLPKLRVNQVGYFPGARKLAIVAGMGEERLDWQLKHGGRLLAFGKTKVLGQDVASGEFLQTVDFTKVDTTAQGVVLTVGRGAPATEQTSYPFDLSNDLYAQLKYDALKYFYHNRSGIEIEMPYAGDPALARPAGHGKSDQAVPCAKDAGCSYALDVSKGWYDAGDHGKYVVNGGIALWTLMNAFERFVAFGDVRVFGDGKLGIPESSNGVPDILDEARWEMEFMLGMQVPQGEALAGMAHHKMHDVEWTALGLAPHEAEAAMKRQLRPPSTAATLNLAATAAQAARLFRRFDAKFAARCLLSAERAYAAAKANPARLAPASDSQAGGGPYNDEKVSDEFYWAAAELYITTKQPKYRTDLLASKYHKTMTDPGRGALSIMTWQDTDALGTLSLSLSKGVLSAAEVQAQRDKVIVSADALVRITNREGYRFPFSAGPDGKYPWGSNSFVLTNAIALAYAYDFTKKDDYLEAAIAALDYVLGRNALAQSYVTGYGEWPLRHPHHRFWARQASPGYPEAPAGAVSGGPNSSLQDPYVRSAGLLGCAAQKCFVDHIEAWSVNEIAINWNAPLAWVAAYLDENGRRATAASQAP